ncbi:DUF2730 domain-containing protein [Paracoccus denitrificans]|uniref:DUF2730 domain-containing protein n=1 Tax=Paracoccus denitrificans TaxID=266 RepID=UPI001E5FC325|nr:DUF2730 domain-containing protein [Paracoccus denitrificans]UFS63826.1 DUF2730 domain-containing protein [Paracoccus denitrificans]
MTASMLSLGPALAVILAGLNILNIVYTWWRTRDQNVEARFKAGSERMDRIDNRLASVEQTLRGAATKEDMHQVQLGLATLGGELREIRAMQGASVEHGKRQDIVLTRLEQFLLEHK